MPTGGTRETTRNVPTPQDDRARFCITDDEVLTLADCAILIEDHYSTQAGRPTPMDIEWAKDGIDRRALHRPGAARRPSRRSSSRRHARELSL